MTTEGERRLLLGSRCTTRTVTCSHIKSACILCLVQDRCCCIRYRLLHNCCQYKIVIRLFHTYKIQQQDCTAVSLGACLSASTQAIDVDASVSLDLAAFCRSEKVVLVSAGFQGDIVTLQKLMQSRNVAYQHNHRKPMGVKALAQMLGNTLYYKRFFPYYTWNLTCGLDEKGILTYGFADTHVPHL